MADRQAYRARVEVRPRFRCLVCRRFVEGTDHGTCPACGWQPPSLRDGSPRPPPRVTIDRTRLWGAALAVGALAALYFTR
jgi:hypothetical protein